MALTDNLLSTQEELVAQATALTEKVATLGGQISDVQGAHTAAIVLRDDIIEERDATIVQLQARIAELESPSTPLKTVFSWDVSSLGDDANRTEATKIASHKTLFGVDSIQNVRVFFGSDVPVWTDARIAQLTEKDSCLISTLSRDKAALLTFLKNTPDRFRKRAGQVKLAHGHERDAELTTASLLQGWLDGNAEKADLLVAAGIPTMSEDDLVKITLHYSQEGHGVFSRGAGIPTREQMYGGQNYGIYGEDCYAHRTWINQKNRYETPEEQFGGFVAFLKQIGLPGAVPEWGAERASTNGVAPMDSTGAGRAKYITDGGAYLKAQKMADGSPLFRFVNWWCADGFRDGARVLHHLEETGTTAPEVAAYKTLVQG